MRCRRGKKNSIFFENVVNKMVSYNSHSLCKQAEVYYYDFIFNNKGPAVPLSVSAHINDCQCCLEQIDKLKRMVSDSEGNTELNENRPNAAKSIMLELHFAYSGKPVTCQTVKPFLPTLLESALEVRIPTPITVHLDKCRQCREDLETIGNLGLNIKQLRRLSQMFAETSSPQQLNCSETQDAISAVASMYFDNVNEDVLKHISICPECRNRIYQQRDSLIKELLQNNGGKGEFCGKDISAADIFDYVVPYGLNPANDQYSKFGQVKQTHLSGCPACLIKMQNLHNTLYSIAERNESEVVTEYHIDRQAAKNNDDLYSGFPIRVEAIVGGQAAEAIKKTGTTRLEKIFKSKALQQRAKPLIKIAAAAAILIIAVAFLSNVPAAKAVTIEQICKAIASIKNIHISRYSADSSEPAQEIWVSRSLNIFMTKTGGETVLSDLMKSTIKSRRADASLIETSVLSKDLAANIDKTMHGLLGLVPFNDIAEIPANAKWEREDKEGSQTTVENIDVYDLIWVGKASDGTDIFYKWRVFLNPATNLPKKTELYQKTIFDKDYSLSSITIVENLSEDEIKSSFEKFSS